MSKIKVSELFYALQGEGRYVGTPSVFLRTFGCNFRCKNFGRDKTPIDGPNPEVAEIIKNVGLYKKIEDMPLVATGCDSYAAVYPEFKNLSPTRQTSDLAREMTALTPGLRFDDTAHIIFTGGEPFLWQKQLADLVVDLDTEGNNVLNVTFETNGTKMPTDDMYSIANRSNLHFSVSPKLSCSGELRADAIKPEVIRALNEIAEHVDFKFVVATQDDLDEVLDIMHNEFAEFDNSVYLMPVGGLNEGYQLNKAQVADFALKYGMLFSPRLQCEVSENKWGT